MSCFWVWTDVGPHVARARRSRARRGQAAHMNAHVSALLEMIVLIDYSIQELRLIQSPSIVSVFCATAFIHLKGFKGSTYTGSLGSLPPGSLGVCTYICVHAWCCKAWIGASAPNGYTHTIVSVGCIICYIHVPSSL